MSLRMPIQISHPKEKIYDYYRLNLILTFVGTRHEVILTNRMVRSITAFNFLFNNFLRTEFFSPLSPNDTLRTFRQNFGIYQNTGCSTRKEAIFLRTCRTWPSPYFYYILHLNCKHSANPDLLFLIQITHPKGNRHNYYWLNTFLTFLGSR